MNNTQSNTQEGLTTFLAGADDLTGKEGYLVKIVDTSSGRGTVELPDAASDPCQFVVEDGAESGKLVSVRPLDPNRSIRMRCNGSAGIEAGVAVCITSSGTIQTVTGLGSGTYWIVGYAEENITAGALGLIRPMPRIHTV